MTATNHGLFGSFIAITLHSNPVLAVIIALFSHFLLDSLPHFGDSSMSLHSNKFFRILSFDALTAVVTTLIIAAVWSEYALLIIACAFLAASPDLMWIYYQYMNEPAAKKHLVPKFHGWIQWSQTPRGAYIELSWFVFFFVFLVHWGL